MTIPSHIQIATSNVSLDDLEALRPGSCSSESTRTPSTGEACPTDPNSTGRTGSHFSVPLVNRGVEANHASGSATPHSVSAVQAAADSQMDREPASGTVRLFRQGARPSNAIPDLRRSLNGVRQRVDSPHGSAVPAPHNEVLFSPPESSGDIPVLQLHPGEFRSPVTNDIAERPEDWLSDDDNEAAREAGMAGAFSPAPESAFTDLAGKVRELFAARTTAVVMITQVTSSAEGDVVAWQLARHLTDGGTQKVLLFDSHLERKGLSSGLGLETAPGLTDFSASEGTPLANRLCRTQIQGLDFIPAGTATLNRANPLPDRSEIDKIVVSLRNRYRFVIVFAGGNFEQAAELWAPHADATFVALGMTRANQIEARLGIARLQQVGAMVTGSVLTDAA